MANWTTYTNDPVGYDGFAENYLERGNVILPPNTELAISAVINRDAYAGYLNRGVTALMVPGGNGKAFNSLFPGNRQSLLTGQSWFRDPTGNLAFERYTPATIETLRQYYRVAMPDAKYVMNDIDEGYDGAALIRYEVNPAMYELLYKTMGQDCESRGILWLGNYGGAVIVTETTAAVMTALQSNANARAYLSGPGSRDLYPYFRLNLQNYGCHLTISTYSRAPNSEHDRMLEHELSLNLGRMAMDDTGSGKKIAGVGFWFGNEFVSGNHQGDGDGFTAFYRKRINADNNLITADWTQVTYGMQTAMRFMEALDTDIIADWEVPHLLGNNPAAVQPERFNPDRVRLYGVNGNMAGVTVANPTGWLNRNAQAGYVGKPSGNLSGCFDGLSMAGIACNHASPGQKLWFRPTMSRAGEVGGYTPGVGNTFLKTIGDNQLPFARCYRNPASGRGWVFAYLAAHRDSNGGRQDVTFDVGGGVSRTVAMVPDTPFFATFES